MCVVRISILYLKIVFTVFVWELVGTPKMDGKVGNYIYEH